MKNTIFLNDKFISKSSDEIARTITHEIGHLYDFRSKIHRNKKFLTLVDWYKRGLFQNVRDRNFHNRKAHPSEDKNRQEAFAYNFEFFLFDKEFKCRRPALYNFFKDHLNHLSFPRQECSSKISFPIKKGPIRTEVSFDLSQLHSVHYLFAGEGKEIMSRYGHAMFRLVFCPKNTPLSNKCIKNLSHSIVISYAAEVPDSKINKIKGLTGKYSSSLVFYPLRTTLKKYNRTELREVTSYPLSLNKKEKELFALLAIEKYWSYKSKYYFLTNNCATEATNHLRAIISSQRLQKKGKSVPSSLKSYLANLNLIDTSFEADLERANQDGLYFPSEKLAHEKRFELFSSLGLFKEYSSFDDFLVYSRAKDRLFQVKNFLDSSDDLNLKITLLANLKTTEKYISNYIASSMQEDLQEYQARLERDKSNIEDLSTLEQRDQLFIRLNKEGRKKSFLKSGYGIPYAKDFPEFEKEEFIRIQISILKEIAEIELKTEVLREDKNEISNIGKNIEFINDSLSRLF